MGPGRGMTVNICRYFSLFEFWTIAEIFLALTRDSFSSPLVYVNITLRDILVIHFIMPFDIPFSNPSSAPKLFS